MKSIKHYDDFTDVLNRMNNDDFALFLTGYAESIGRNIQLLPIHIDKFDCLAWVGYFTENGGLNGDDENRFIVIHQRVIAHRGLQKSEKRSCANKRSVARSGFPTYSDSETCEHVEVSKRHRRDHETWTKKGPHDARAWCGPCRHTASTGFTRYHRPR